MFCSEADDTRTLRLDTACCSGPRCRTTDVEGTHRKLRTRFADRLRGDHTDCFTGVHQLTAAEVTAVALGAQAITGFAGQRLYAP
jgi:hypothetical protein